MQKEGAIEQSAARLIGRRGVCVLEKKGQKIDRDQTVASRMISSSDSAVSMFKTWSINFSAASFAIARVALDMNFALIASIDSGTSGEPRLAGFRQRSTLA